MKVGNVATNLSFESNRRKYYIGPFRDVVYTQTEMNRRDVDFENLARFMIKEFADKPKVNIYSLACSDGSEPYSLAICLKEVGGKNIEKFFPIIASDKDGVIINSASRGIINVTDDEFKSFNYDLSKYLTQTKKRSIPADSLDDLTKTYVVSEDLRKDVNFEQKTILQQLNNINNEQPNVILCRNVLNYLGGKEEELYHVNAICKKLANKDILVIGDYDRGLHVIKTIENQGFKKIFSNVFQKLL